MSRPIRNIGFAGFTALPDRRFMRLT